MLPDGSRGMDRRAVHDTCWSGRACRRPGSRAGRRGAGRTCRGVAGLSRGVRRRTRRRPRGRQRRTFATHVIRCRAPRRPATRCHVVSQAQWSRSRSGGLGYRVVRSAAAARLSASTTTAARPADRLPAAAPDPVLESPAATAAPAAAAPPARPSVRCATAIRAAN